VIQKVSYGLCSLVTAIHMSRIKCVEITLATSIVNTAASAIHQCDTEVYQAFPKSKYFVTSLGSLSAIVARMKYGLFAPLPFRPLDDSPPGSFAPWLIRPRTAQAMQGANRPRCAGESARRRIARGRKSQGANRLGGETAKGRKSQIPARILYYASAYNGTWNFKL